MPRAAAAERVSEVEKLVNKRYPGALRRASDPALQIVKLPTGILSLDVCLDGGLARGRHHEIYGLNHVGKTYITFRLIAQTQRDGGKCAFVDVENTFDPRFAAHAGVKLNELDVPEHGLYGDDLINIMELLIYSREYSVIVLDSIASLLPKAEAEKALGEGTYGTQQARLMSSAMRKLTTANRDVCLVYINQMRENIGVMFGKKYTPTGGKAMSFYAGTRLELSRVEQIKRKRRRVDSKGEERVVDVVRGHRVLVKVEKDKTGGAMVGDETTFVYDYDLGGVDPVEDLLYLGRSFGLIHKSGTRWWVDGFEEEAQTGRSKMHRWLRRNVAVAEELEGLIRTAASEPRAVGEMDASEGDESA